MALSNIFNEPRREITETLIGILVMTLPAYVVYLIANAYCRMDNTLPYVIALVLAIFSLVLGIFAVIGLSAFVYFVGEEICDLLDDCGIRLRPRERR